MVGAVISCAGILLSSLSTNVLALILTYGVIGGFGQGLIYVTACVSAGFWFEKKRALARNLGGGVPTQQMILYYGVLVKR